jgi:hypothetical protein
MGTFFPSCPPPFACFPGLTKNQQKGLYVFKPFISLALLFASAIAIISFNQVAVGAIAGAVGIVLLFSTIKEQAKDNRRVGEETRQADTKLRAEVIAVQKLAFEKLSGASDEFKTEVAATVAEAAMHLGYPYLGGQRVYGPGYVLNWNNEGLSLIAEARRMVEAYTPPSRE